MKQQLICFALKEESAPYHKIAARHPGVVTLLVGTRTLTVRLAVMLLLVLGWSRVPAATGFSVNGNTAQTGYVIGQGVCCGGDWVAASGTFAGAYAKNPGNTYYPELVLISSNTFITSPGSQPYVTNTGAFTGSDSNTYTNYTYYQSLCYFSAGGLTNYGWLNYSNVNTAPGNSTFLNAYDGQIGTAPGVTGNFNRNYYWGNGAYINDANVKYWGGPVNVLNGATNNPNAMITAVVNGTNQVNVAGLNVWAWYGDSTMTAITEANYGTIAGSYTGSYNGTAAGIYSFTDYGGMNITNAASGVVTAKAPYYADGIYAWCQYGNLNLVQNGLVTGTATGGQNGNTAGIGDAVGMDLFTYSTTNTASINLLNTGTVTANATAYTNLFSVAVFCWAEGGSFTFTNTGTLTATGHCTMTPFSSSVNTFYGGSSRGPVTLYNSGTVIGNADTNGGGGWAYGTENDNGDSISVVNSGTLYHNTGLGLFIYGVGPSSNGVATVTNTSSGSIYGGLEGIAAEHYYGQLTIYDSGTVMAGTSNNNAMNLGAPSAVVTVRLYGLPKIVGSMNGHGRTNVLDFHLVGTLQKVNGGNPTQSTNLAAYNFGLTGSQSIVVSGQTYKWSGFNVTGSVTPPPVLAANVVASGTNAQLSWSTNYTGWTLQVQTNSLTAGLGTNWQDVAGSSSTNQVNLTLPPPGKGAFYRLKLP